MTPEELMRIQESLGLSDNKMAKAIGVTRQTWRNWRTGRPCPLFAQNALRWLMELRKLSPSNDNIPKPMRFLVAMVAAVFGIELLGVIE